MRQNCLQRSWIAKFSALALFVLLAPAVFAQQQWSVGYYTPNSNGGGPVLPPAAIEFSGLTHVVYWGGIVHSNGTLDLTSQQLTTDGPTLIAAAHANGVKVLLGLLEANWLSGDTATFQPAITNNLSTLMSNVMSTVDTYGFDGVDIDWEQSGSPFAGNPSGTAMLNFLSALRTALGTKLLTAAAMTADSAFWGSTAKNYLDRVSVMTYDLTGTWNPYSWHNAALYSPSSDAVWSVDLAVQRFTAAGVPASKLNIGIPFYGWKWSGGGVSAPYQTWPSTPALTQVYYDNLSSAISGGAYGWDSAAQVPYASYNTGNMSTDQFITYDNPQSVTAKVSYTQSKGLGGWIIWELVGDYFPTQTPNQPLLDAIRIAMGNSASSTSTTTPTTTTPTTTTTTTPSSSGSTSTTGSTTSAGGGTGISFDASSKNYGAGGNNTSLSWSHTTGSGSNAVLIVSVGTYYADDVSAVTYNGVGLTHSITACYSTCAAQAAHVSVWYLVNPSPGVHAVAVTINRAGGDYAMAGAMSFFGVDSSNPIDATASAFSSGANPSGTITPVNNNAFSIDNVYAGNNIALSASSWTNQYLINDTQGSQSFGGALKGPISPPSPQTDLWISAGGAPWADALLTLKPASTSSSTPAPTISSFTASPGSISSGSSSTLSWNTSGATSITITPGSFSSTNASGSTTVSPTATTTYTLTATNATGSTTAQTTVTVTAGGGTGISFDASSKNYGAGGNNTSLSWSHTTGAGSNAVLIVSVGTYYADDVSAVSYNGVGLTHSITACYSSCAVQAAHVSVWYLVNPSPGTHAVAVTINRAGGDYAMAGAMSFFGVNPSNPIDATASAFSSGANPSGTITPVNNNAFSIDTIYAGNNIALSASSWTNQYLINDTQGSQSLGGAYKGPISPPSPQTDLWTSAGGGAWADALLTLKPASN